jgi:hypothetical protein
MANKIYIWNFPKEDKTEGYEILGYGIESAQTLPQVLHTLRKYAQDTLDYQLVNQVDNKSDLSEKQTDMFCATGPHPLENEEFQLISELYEAMKQKDEGYQINIFTQGYAQCAQLILYDREILTLESNEQELPQKIVGILRDDIKAGRDPIINNQVPEGIEGMVLKESEWKLFQGKYQFNKR